MSKTYQKKAALLRESIREIIALNGHCTPKLLLESARSKASPIHSFFEWNQRTAAEAWRLEQASTYLRKITIRLECGNSETVLTREFVHLPSEVNGTRGKYITIGQAIEDDEVIDKVMAAAAKDLRVFQERYAVYQRLAGTRHEVSKAIYQLKKQTKQRTTA